jgi:hypothetical protein
VPYNLNGIVVAGAITIKKLFCGVKGLHFPASTLKCSYPEKSSCFECIVLLEGSNFGGNNVEIDIPEEVNFS